MRSAHLIAAAGSVGTSLASSLLLSGGTIIAWDEKSASLNVIRDGALLVTDDRIAGLYDTANPKGLPKDTEIVDCENKIISPGFIDTHRHGWQTGMKTLPSNTTLPDYLHRYAAWAAASFYTPEDVYIGQLAGLLEALNAGVTTTLDHAHSAWSSEHGVAGLDASLASGARVYWHYAFASMPGYGVPQQIEDYRKWLTTKVEADGLVSMAVAYDMWSAEPPEHTTQVLDLIKETNPPAFTTHWLGGVWGFDNSPALLHSHGILNTSMAVVLSHATDLNPNAAELLRSTNQFISITPESEMHYGHSHFHSHRLHDQAALGVDTHLAFSTDMVTQARLWLQRTRSRLYDEVYEDWQVPLTNPMSANQAFLLATRQGALALRRPDLGVIRVGAKADLVVFDGRSPALLGWVDPVAAVILHSNVGDVQHVLVDGRFRKRDGRLTHEDYDAVADRFLASAETLRRAIVEKPAPVITDRFFGSACDYGRPVVPDGQRGEGNGYGELFWGKSTAADKKIVHEEL